MPVSTLPEGAEGESADDEAPVGSEGGTTPDQSVLLESTLPLRTENADGQMEAVDLTLRSPEGSGGELQPQNPLAEVAIPARLEEGISAGPVGIEVLGTEGERSPTNVEGQYAFYPNVAQNTDLAVTPTPAGVETMTNIRSAEAPRSTTYRLSLPEGATLEPVKDGGAEVAQGGRTILVVPPATAIDAAGAAVAVEMEVEGDELTVTTSPDSSTAYPILVDPWFSVENWCWSECLSAFAGWSGSTTTASYGTSQSIFGYGYTGLDISSGYPGSANSGDHADWSYTVPRYSQDIGRYGSPPSSYVVHLSLSNMLVNQHGSAANYPALVTGLVQPGVGWAGATAPKVHYGGEGEYSLWGSNLEFDNAAPNTPENHAIKAADMNLVTYEYESQAKWRDSFIGLANIWVADEEAPRILELKAPSGWVRGPSAAIGYNFEDTGLGVRVAGVRQGPAEPTFKPGWTTDFGCTGASASPCPRKVQSSEAGAKTVPFVPSELPTGEDRLEVDVGDPLWGEWKEPAHIGIGFLTVKVDNLAPEVTLSGSLTEQEKLGIEATEYQLGIAAKDGTETDPQSGVTGIEVKVDGKKVTMANEAEWKPGCKEKNCSLSRSWAMKASGYSVGSHEVEVLATDAAGNVTEESFEVEFGQAPPQTSFTSPHPSHETTDIEEIAFKATRNGAPVEGATFRCSLDGAAASPCTSPEKLPERLEDKPHTFTVAAVDKGGKVDPTPATWSFETNPYPASPPSANEKLVFPETGKQTASYYTLEAEWGANPEGKAGEGVTGVTFQVQLPGWKKNEKGEYIWEGVKRVVNTFETVPAECVIDGQGRQISWPLPVHTHPGHNAPVYLKVRGCPLFEHAEYPEKEIKFRAVFDGGAKVAGASEPATTEFVSHYNANRVPTDATESVGPASVDLLTGAYTVSATDVSIPVPGYAANLEFTRT